MVAYGRSNLVATPALNLGLLYPVLLDIRLLSQMSLMPEPFVVVHVDDVITQRTFAANGKSELRIV